jgi:hypothetical protein
MPSNLRNEEIHLLINAAFQKAKIEGRKITDCQKLSAHIKVTCKGSISKTTIYRMHHIEKYGIKPYDYSVRLLFDFLGITSIDELLEDCRKNGSFKKKKVQQTALAILLEQQLQKERLEEVKIFLHQLPNDFSSLGAERHIIGAVFGQYFRSLNDHKKRLNIIEYLSEEENFLLYFFETFPDFDNAEGYFSDSLAAIIRKLKYEHLLASASSKCFVTHIHPQTSRAVYFFSLYILLSYCNSKWSEVAEAGKILFPNEKAYYRLDDQLKDNLILRTRLLNAYLIFKSIHGRPDKELIPITQALIEDHLNSTASIGGKIFLSTIMQDNLLMLNKETLIHHPFLKDEFLINKSLVNKDFEPFFERFLAYASKDYAPSQKIDFFYGDYEKEFSRQLISKAKSPRPTKKEKA